MKFIKIVTMPSLFLITSAINTKFGVFKPAVRFSQTLETISSIRSLMPDAKIVVLEMCATSLNNEQSQAIKQHVDLLLEFHNDHYVQKIYEAHRWSIVKNLTEIRCFQLALTELIKSPIFENISRVYKISGRYRLNQEFDAKLHSSQKICLSGKHPSQFPIDLTGVPFTYMSRLWSWPVQQTSLIEDVYIKGLAYVKQQIGRGLYCDIEHMLYKYIPENLVEIVAPIGLEGSLGPNGVLVKD